jgi:hypothetical protein
MVRSFVEAMLGRVGTQVLYFYEAHALPINLVLLTYGLIMFMSWLTLVRIYRYMVVRIAKDIHLHPELNRKSTLKQIRDALDIPWQEAVDAAPFPLVASQVALLPVPKSTKAVQAVIDERDLVRSALEVLKGANPRSIRPSYRMMWRKEVTKQDDQD